MPHVQLASALLYKPAPICLTLICFTPSLAAQTNFRRRPGTAKPKATLPTILRQESLAAIHAISTLGTITYFTDGSVSAYGAAGAAFVCEGHVHSCRITDGVSAFQAELTAIQCALEHARTLRDGAINIFTDSLSSLEALDHLSLKDNVLLLSSIYHLFQRLAAHNNTITLYWVPGHVGIAGNERADQ
ncbi:Gag-Pol polyprotein [Chionoecetes opilio]|uniref:Gag-Pol polyprotein n=1 Tax=Chionoecetes opilio TaxID=41210 RepID=A0A8J5CJV8_CHIOP|nr:Gag-Pol polyprotein [Chionoecetes opilio]